MSSLLFHLTSFLLFCTTRYLNTSLWTRMISDGFNKSHSEQYKFLTNWTMHVNLLYHCYQTIILLPSFRNRRPPSPWFWTSFVFPISLTCVLLYWGVWVIDPGMIASKIVMEKYYGPLDLTNNLLHTFPLVVNVLEGLMRKGIVTQRMTNRKIFKGNLLFLVLYNGNLFWFRNQSGSFAYPLLDVVWKAGTHWFIIFNLCVLIFFFVFSKIAVKLSR